MPPITIGIIGICILFFLLFAMRFPIATAMTVVGFAGLWYLKSASAAMIKLSIVPFDVVTNYSMTTLPLYVFMACVLTNAGFGNELFLFCSRLIGHVRGGLAAATTVAMAVLGAVSPNSLANLTIMGRMAFPEMVKRGYNPELASGIIASGAGLGSLIPPSGPLIILGVMTGVSIGKLFMAGIIPGITLALLLVILIFVMCAFNPKLAQAAPKSRWKERFAALGGCVEILILILFMLYGITVGWFTPNEAAATGCGVALLSTFLRKRFSWSMVKQSFLDTLHLSGLIYLMLVGVFMFTAFCSASEITLNLAALVNSLHVSSYVIMLVIFAIYFILGCIMDVLSMIALTIPIFFPLVVSLGFDPVWFCVEIVLVSEIGNITPPIALNVWLLGGILKDQIPMGKIYRGILPFLGVEVAFLLIMLFLPQIVTFLPGLMK
jgi:C4-dicarboxylate transporter, DctM subunit